MAPKPASWLLAALAVQLACPGARAAEIRLERLPRVGISIITVVGEITQEDGERFSEVAAQVRGHAAVEFDSPGGSLLAGLQIGQVTRLHHFATFVADGVVCASACAFAWLSGAPRIMQAHSHIGFHAAFIEKGGAKIESGVGNALAGAYLNNLQLSFEAIVYVEQAHPDEITWLTVADANRLGIAVRVMPSRSGHQAQPEEEAPEPANRPAAAPTPPPRRHDPATSVLLPELTAPEPVEATPILSQEDRARRFVSEYFAHWSEAGPEALRYFEASYSPEVAFYGRTVARDALMAGKRSYVQRWPVRVYTARPETMRVFCNEATRTCTATGTVDWDCRNPGRGAQSSGAARFLLTVEGAAGEETILAENGAVLSRDAEPR